MKRPILKTLALGLTGLGLSTTLSAEPVTQCYNDVCATLEANRCVAPGEPFDLKVEGELQNAGSFSMTAYQVLRDASWHYNANHQVVVESGEVVDAKGLLFTANFAKNYSQKGGEASRYTFVFGSRNFGHGFYDVAVETELGTGAGTSPVAVDIKPGTCPNPVNAHLKGVLPVAVLGGADFDVRDLDPASVTLAGVPLLRHDFEDVSAPIPGAGGGYECTTGGGDGVEDMTLKFKTEAVIAALEAQLGRALLDGEVIPLELKANLKEGSSACDGGLTGVDHITVLDRGKGKNR